MVTIWIPFGNITPCWLIVTDVSKEHRSCQVFKSGLFDLEDGGTTVPRNIGNRQLTRFNISEGLNLRNFAVRTANVALVEAVLFALLIIPFVMFFPSTPSSFPQYLRHTFFLPSYTWDGFYQILRCEQCLLSVPHSWDSDCNSICWLSNFKHFT